MLLLLAGQSMPSKVWFACLPISNDRTDIIFIALCYDSNWKAGGFFCNCGCQAAMHSVPSKFASGSQAPTDSLTGYHTHSMVYEQCGDAFTCVRLEHRWHKCASTLQDQKSSWWSTVASYTFAKSCLLASKSLTDWTKLCCASCIANIRDDDEPQHMRSTEKQ